MDADFSIRISRVGGSYKTWCPVDNFEFDTTSHETFFEVLENHINTKHKEVPIGANGVSRGSDADTGTAVHGDAATSAQPGNSNPGTAGNVGAVPNRVWSPPAGVPVRIESSDFYCPFDAPWSDGW